MPRPTPISSSAIDDARIGQVFADRYEIVRRLGTGGMAVVYAGLDRMLQREVALKILKPQVMDDPLAIERLRREARAAGRLYHRHIITFHDVGTSDGTVFIVMELLRGRTLAAERRRCQRLAAARVARIGAQVASALRVVHAAGIIHRDLKPDNVFLIEQSSDDFCKLLDFSIAKLPATLVDGRITQTGTVHGTPHYMSPEQAIGDPVSAASDIYSLGAVLFELLVGRPPFHADNVVELLTVQGSEDAPRVRTLEPDCPPALDALIATMLARDARDRPPTAEAVHEALLAIIKQCRQKGGEPPPLPRKRLPAADRTVKSGAFEPAGGLGDAPTGPLATPEVLAPSAVRDASGTGSALRYDPTAVRRPRSAESRSVAKRTASVPPPSGRAGAETSATPVASARAISSRRVVRARGRVSQKKKTPVGVAAPPPASSPADLPSAPRTQGRRESRGHRSTVPNWSGQPPQTLATIGTDPADPADTDA